MAIVSSDPHLTVKTDPETESPPDQFVKTVNSLDEEKRVPNSSVKIKAVFFIGSHEQNDVFLSNDGNEILKKNNIIIISYLYKIFTQLFQQ